jgi:hypothetical protein
MSKSKKESEEDRIKKIDERLSNDKNVNKNVPLGDILSKIGRKPTSSSSKVRGKKKDSE